MLIKKILDIGYYNSSKILTLTNNDYHVTKKQISN